MLNRCAVTVRAREPFRQWLASLPDPEDARLAELNSEITAYLLPDYDEDHQRQLLLSRYFDLIFEDQLAAWWTDRRDWPAHRTLAMFEAWFAVEFHSVVIDLVADQLRDDG